ncbi:MAG: hypothetical protein P1U77_14775 [Rubripirellula sp.]|nr:hypothetical protein [Rubripirellula sp.]
MPSKTAAATLTLLSLYAVAMAQLEAVVVIYMRQLYYPEQPLELFPLEFLTRYDPMVELSREVSTIVMIIAVALLAERQNLTRRFAAFVYVFGLWDVCYYAWLKILFGWPRTWLEWDVLFLIPVIWLGPWICPAAIGLLFCVWGALVLGSNRRIIFSGRHVALFVVGACVGLVAFMQPAASFVMRAGREALVGYVPDHFSWPLYILGYCMMTLGLLGSLRDRPCETTIQVQAGNGEGLN